MQSDRFRKLVKGVLLTAIAVSVIVGCSDNPQNKAAKELYEATEKAMTLAEKGPRLDDKTQENAGEVFAEARSQLNRALVSASVAGNAAGAAYLAGGNLDFAQVRYLRKELHNYTLPVSTAVDELSVMSRKITSLQVQQERLDQIIIATNDEIDKLTSLVEGTNGKPGLKTKLATAESQLSQLESEKSEWSSRQQKSLDEAGQIQQSADAKLQKADLLEGREKEAIQKEGFALLLSKKEPLVKAQEAEDRAVILQSKINTVSPTVSKLQNDIQRITEQIDEIVNGKKTDQGEKDEPQIEKIKIQSEEVRAEIDKFNAQAEKLVSELKAGVNDYTEQVSKITALLDNAVSDYKKIRSRSLSQTAKSQIADSHFWKASVLADSIGFRQHVGARLGYIAASDMGNVSSILTDAGLELSQAGEESSKAVIDAYNEAITAYKDIPGGSSRDTMSNHALALYGKMAFAERLGDYDTADAALDEVDKLLETISQADPVFFTSVTSKILTGSTEFIPPMSVDLAAQYEELKKQFQPWKKLRGDDKKAEVEKMLAMLDNMKSPLDPQEFDRIIGPERKAMEDQMAKGFDEPVNTNDPNFL